jgi:predicted hotdog family 3-hydroxylacyl-ACP dehydratase
VSQPMQLIKPPPVLQRTDIAMRIPHQGAMCLLDRVTSWDSSQIFCEALSHTAPGNPLREYGRLGAACGVEYAAQAMAVHGALIAEAVSASGKAAPASKVGYLVSVRGVMLHVERLDDLSGALAIHAQRVTGDDASILYSFTVHFEGALLVSGRAVVLLDAAPSENVMRRTTSASSSNVGATETP